MYQAIQTKFIGPTNHRSSRVKAWADAGTVTLEWNHALNPERNHAAVAKALAKKLGWNGVYTGGSLPGSGYAFVLNESVFIVSSEA